MRNLLVTQSVRRLGFTLIELMVVVAIVALIVGLTVGVTKGSLGSIELSTTANDISALFNQAKEEALVNNTNVQVRIYETPDPDFGEVSYNSIGIGVIETPEDLSDVTLSDPDSLTFKLLSKKLRIPNSIRLMEKAPYSTLISDAVQEGTEDDDELGAIPYKAFAFRPNNRADLPTSGDEEWTLTVIPRLDDITTLPENFITLQLYPDTGRINQIEPN